MRRHRFAECAPKADAPARPPRAQGTAARLQSVRGASLAPVSAGFRRRRNLGAASRRLDRRRLDEPRRRRRSHRLRARARQPAARLQAPDARSARRLDRQGRQPAVVRRGTAHRPHDAQHPLARSQSHRARRPRRTRRRRRLRQPGRAAATFTKNCSASSAPERSSPRCNTDSSGRFRSTTSRKSKR